MLCLSSFELYSRWVPLNQLAFENIMIIQIYFPLQATISVDHGMLCVQYNVWWAMAQWNDGQAPFLISVPWKLTKIT